MSNPWPRPGESVPEISVQELAGRLKAEPRPFLLDVRQPWEHQQASLAGSVLVPLNRLAAEIEALRGQVPAGTPVVVYCHHGMRSLVGAQALLQAGFPNVCSLAGGIDAWSVLIDPTTPRY